MNKIIHSIIFASSAIIATSSAWACEPMHKGSMGEKFFEEMDSNHDGAVSKKEFDAFHNKHFKELDANNDGKITKEEMQATHAKMYKKCDDLISKRFEAADANHDGALTKEEAKDMQMLSKHFDEIDTNKDGKVTLDEVKAMMDKHHAEGEQNNTTEKAVEKK